MQKLAPSRQWISRSQYQGHQTSSGRSDIPKSCLEEGQHQTPQTLGPPSNHIWHDLLVSRRPKRLCVRVQEIVRLALQCPWGPAIKKSLTLRQGGLARTHQDGRPISGFGGVCSGGVLHIHGDYCAQHARIVVDQSPHEGDCFPHQALHETPAASEAPLIDSQTQPVKSLWVCTSATRLSSHFSYRVKW
jgi:hypothetical protein